MKADLLLLSRDTDKKTEETLLVLRQANRLTDQQLDELVNWIQETPFAAKPTRAWIGEIAAELLRKNAKKSKLWKLCRVAQGWPLYFFLIALSDDRCNAEYTVQLHRAVSSSEPAIRAYAEESLWSLESAVAESVD